MAETVSPMKYWPVIVLAGGVVGAAYVGQYRIEANAQSIEARSGAILDNAKAIVILKDRVIEEGTHTQLELQRLRLQQEAAQRSAEARDATQQRTLEAILQAVKP